MSQYLSSEDQTRLETEACDICGEQVSMPDDSTKRPWHICKKMFLDDKRFYDWVKHVTGLSPANLISSIKKKPLYVRFLPSETVEDLQLWTWFDLMLLPHISYIRADSISTAMKLAGLPLLELSSREVIERRDRYSDPSTSPYIVKCKSCGYEIGSSNCYGCAEYKRNRTLSF